MGKWAHGESDRLGESNNEPTPPHPFFRPHPHLNRACTSSWPCCSTRCSKRRKRKKRQHPPPRPRRRRHRRCGRQSRTRRTWRRTPSCCLTGSCCTGRWVRIAVVVVWECPPSCSPQHTLTLTTTERSILFFPSPSPLHTAPILHRPTLTTDNRSLFLLLLLLPHPSSFPFPVPTTHTPVAPILRRARPGLAPPRGGGDDDDDSTGRGSGHPAEQPHPGGGAPGGGPGGAWGERRGWDGLVAMGRGG